MIQASEKCFELVKHFEGCKLQAYPDSDNLPTIGIGCTRYPDDKPVKLGDTCTMDQAKQWFLWDLKEAEDRVKIYIPKYKDLAQCQYDALVSFSYNVGFSIKACKSLITHVNKNPNGKEVIDAFGLYVKAGGKTIAGLVRRRKAESWLYAHNELKYFEPLKK